MLAECTHAHGEKFKGGCDIESHDFYPGGYKCKYEGYPEGHEHFIETVHGLKPIEEGDMIILSDNAGMAHHGHAFHNHNHHHIGKLIHNF